MAQRTIKKIINVLDGKRTLHLIYDDTDLSGLELAIAKVRLPRVVRRVIIITNNCFAKGLAYRSAEDMLNKNKSQMIYTRAKDFLRLQVKKQHSGTWSREVDLFSKSFRGEWRLDRNTITKNCFQRVFGNHWATLQENLCTKSMNIKAATVRNTFLSVIGGLNLENIYINVRQLGGVGRSGSSFGGWRKKWEAFDETDNDFLFNRTRMEEHLFAGRAEKPIRLNKKYLSNAYEDTYKGLYGIDYTFEDHLTKTLLHEASHNFAATRDNYYYRPRNGALVAYRPRNHTTAPSAKVNSPSTDECVMNADSFGWFLYFWGGGPDTAKLVIGQN